MRYTLILPLAVAVALPVFSADKKAASPDDQYKNLTPGSEERADVPKGCLENFQRNNSKVFPSTMREMTVYIPAHYNAAKHACILVQQGDFPLKPDEKPRKCLDDRPAPRAYRSKEYDFLSDVYSKFLLKEILPEVGKEYIMRCNGHGHPQGRVRRQPQHWVKINATWTQWSRNFFPLRKGEG